MPKLRLGRFDPTTIPSDCLVLVAPRGSGMSCAVKNILYYMRDIPICPAVETIPAVSKPRRVAAA